MTPRTILNVLRTLFLGSSLACLATAAVWRYAPDLVDRLDAKLVAHHMHRAKRDLSSAQALVADGKREAALELYEDLAVDLRGTMRGDRLFESRKQALEGAADLLVASGDVGPALAWAGELRELDPRDLVNNLRLVRLLRTDGRADEGREVLLETARVAAGDPRLQGDLVAALVEYGEAERAVELLLTHGHEGMLGAGAGNWHAFLPDDAGKLVLHGNLAPESAPGSPETLFRVVPAEAGPARDQLRIDLPPGAWVRVEEVRVRARTADGRELAAPMPDDARAIGLRRVDSGWVCEGSGDAFFVFPVDLGAGDAAVVEYVFALRLVPHLPGEIAQALRASDWHLRRDELVRRHGEDAVVRLEEALRG